MAGVKNHLLRIGADFSAISAQSKKASGAMNAMQTSVSASCVKMQTALGGLKRAFSAIGAVVSVAAIVNFAKDAAAAYDEEAEAEAKLAQVMRNTMGARSDEIRSIKDLTEAQEALGVVDAGVQVAGAQELATYLGQTSSLKKLIPVMNDMIAQQYGYKASAESAVSIATMMGKVMDGQVGALSRYGYSFDAAQEKILKYGTEEQRAATLAEVVEASVGGMNQALAKTPTGRMKQLANTMDGIKVNFGKAVRTIGTAFLPMLNKLASMLADVATLANKFAQTLANVFGGKASKTAYTYAPPAAEGVSSLGDSYDSVADKAKAAEKAQKAALQVADFDTLHILRDNTKDGTDDDSASDEDYAPVDSGIQSMIEDTEEAEESIGWLEEALNKVKGLFEEIDFEPLKKAWQGLKEALDPLVEKIRDGLGWCWENVLKPLAKWTIEKLAPASVDLLTAAFNALDAVLEVLSPVIKALWESILKPVCAWIGDKLIAVINDLTDFLNNLASLLRGDMGLGEFIRNMSALDAVLVSIAGGLLFAKIEEGFMKLKAILSGSGAAFTTFTAGAAGAGTAAGGFGAAAGATVPLLTAGADAAKTSYDAAVGLGSGWLAMTKILHDDVMNPLNDYYDAIYDTSASSDDLKVILDEINGLLAQESQEYENATLFQRAFGSAGEDLLKLQELQTVASAQYETALRKEGKAIQSNSDATKQVTENTQKSASAFEKVKNAGTAAWEKVKSAWNGAGDWFGNIGTSIKDKLSTAFDGAKEKASSAMEGIKTAFNGLLPFLQAVGEQIKSKVSDAFDRVKEIGSRAGETIRNAWSFATNLFESIASTVGSKITDSFDKARTTAVSGWERIKQSWSDVKSWAAGIGQSISSGIINGLSTLVEKVRTVTSEVRSSLSGISGVITSARSSVTSMLSSISSQASSVISSVTSRISSAMTSLKSAGSSVSYSGVPYLANGAVIPPNSQFAAILGDQTHGYNIETPEGLLRQIFREETGAGNDQLIGIAAEILAAVRSGKVITVDGYELGSSIRRSMASQAIAFGR